MRIYYCLANPHWQKRRETDPPPLTGGLNSWKYIIFYNCPLEKDHWTALYNYVTIKTVDEYSYF